MEKRPYRPSWIDRLFEWIDGLSFHSVWFYLGLYVVSAYLAHIPYWMAVPQEQGQLVPLLVLNSLWIFAFAVIHYLRNLSIRAIEAFREHMEGSEAEQEELVYRFTYMPAMVVMIASMLTISIVFFGIFDDAEYYFGLKNVPLSSLVTVSILGAVAYTSLPILFIQSVRLLVLVWRTFHEYTRINIFHLEPLYGLTMVTMNVGVMVILFMSGNLLSEVVADDGTMRPETVIAFTVIMTLLGVASFIVPIWGIHTRIRDAKTEAIGENGAQIERFQMELNATIAAGERDKLAEIGHGLLALTAMRDQLKDVSPWPWRPGTPFNFVSAVLLPLFIVALQVIIERVF